MNKAEFYNGNNKLKILVPESIDEKYRGMKVFKSEKDCEYDGMFFKFDGGIDYMTMSGMKFPLTMIFFNNLVRPIRIIDANIDDDNIPIPQGAVSCLELIKGVAFNDKETNRIEITDKREELMKKLSNLIREVKYGC